MCSWSSALTSSKGPIKSLYFQTNFCKSIIVFSTVSTEQTSIITTAGLNSGELHLWKWEAISQAYQHGQINENQEQYTPQDQLIILKSSKLSNSILHRHLRFSSICDFQLLFEKHIYIVMTASNKSFLHTINYRDS